MSKKIKVLKVCAKCSDLCNISAVDENGDIVGERNDYVPNYFPGEHYGDYVMFDIDVKTGQILNWKTPSQEEIEESLE